MMIYLILLYHLKHTIQQSLQVYLAYNAPHTPLQATEKYLSRFPYIENKRRKTYAAMVSAVDDGVQKVLASLKRNNLDENTIIVFLSDNGGASNNASDNGPLRGKKGDLFEGGNRVPFAIRWKGVIPAGKTFKKAVSSLDIMATIVARNNIKINKDRPLDGVDLIPFLTGENQNTPHDFLFWRKWEQNAMSIRKGNLKLVANRNQKKNEPQLFDISKDIGETNNIKDQYPNEYKALMAKWESINREMKDRVFPTLNGDQWWLTKE